ncbi:MAG: hypothetical protein Q8L29_00180 [archaeon]|nr:hypothetical protein [archaeon]
MKYSAFFIFFLILIISNFASASQYNIEINQVDNKLLVKHSISLDENKEILINIPSDITSLSSNTEYSIYNNILTFEGKDIEFSYITRLALEKSKDGYYYIDDINFNFPIDEAKLTLILKEGYFLDKDKIFPELSIIETDGRQISTSWTIQDVKENSDISIFVSIISDSSLSPWFLLIGIILLGLSYPIYIIFIRKKDKKRDIESHLIDSEKLILKTIKESERGEIWQKQLQLKTNFSKAKLSRVIRNLESRNLVEKIPFGNTNKIRLK